MTRYIPFILSACFLIGLIFLATDVFSQTNPGGTSPVPTGITAGRARALAGGVVGLISLIIGWRARVRSARGGNSGRSWSIAALVLGLICIILSVVHLVTTTGGFGTGGGKAGAIVALVLGLTGTALNGLALRSKRI